MKSFSRLPLFFLLVCVFCGCASEPATQTLNAREKISSLLSLGQTQDQVIRILGTPYRTDSTGACEQIWVYGWGGLIERFDGSIAAFKYGRSLQANIRKGKANPPSLKLTFAKDQLAKIEGV